MIFADSGYFIALWDPKDERHHTARIIETKLADLRWARTLSDLMTCLPMATEVVEHLSLRLGTTEAAAVFSRLLNNCTVIRPTERDIKVAFEGTFRLYAGVRDKRRRPGMVDSVGVALMRRNHISRILSFDRGFDLLPDIRRIRLVGDGAAATLSVERP